MYVALVLIFFGLWRMIGLLRTVGLYFFGGAAFLVFVASANPRPFLPRGALALAILVGIAGALVGFVPTPALKRGLRRLRERRRKTGEQTQKPKIVLPAWKRYAFVLPLVPTIVWSALTLLILFALFAPHIPSLGMSSMKQPYFPLFSDGQFLRDHRHAWRLYHADDNLYYRIVHGPLPDIGDTLPQGEYKYWLDRDKALGLKSYKLLYTGLDRERGFPPPPPDRKFASTAYLSHNQLITIEIALSIEALLLSLTLFLYHLPRRNTRLPLAVAAPIRSPHPQPQAQISASESPSWQQPL